MQLENEVRDAVLGGTEDLVLAKLVEVTMRSLLSEREIFTNPLHEPAFYARYFRPWVKAALDEHGALEKFHTAALTQAGINTRRE